jgi:hypothetical protein
VSGREQKKKMGETWERHKRGEGERKGKKLNREWRERGPDESARRTHEDRPGEGRKR